MALSIQGLEISEKADLVVHNGTVYTVDPKMPVAQAVAVADGRIVFVGDDEGARKWIGDGTQLLDLKGKIMTPGFIEGHGHILAFGNARMRIDLSGAKNYRELVGLVAEAVKGARKGEWILGAGWHQSKWDEPPEPMVKGFQTHELLSRVSPDHPVYLSHASGHAGFANARAMEIAGIGPSAVFTEAGEIVKDDNGNPTGIFVEQAKTLITRHIPETTPEKNRKALKLAMEEILANGITTFHEAVSSREAIALYKAFLQGGNLKVRLWAMIDGRDETLVREWFARGPEIGSGNGFLTIRAVKLFADGAIGSRGAWLLAPYSDRPGHFGHPTMEMEDIYRVSRGALDQGFQVCAHAIGDRANREVLDQFEKAFKENPKAAEDHRFRIEHAQHLNASDIPRFGKLGVIASMQGIHMSSDRPWAIERLGPERIIEGAYAWQKLLSAGATIVNGTDVPVEPINPIASFYASVTRKTLQGKPPGGYEPELKMTREQALRSYTRDAAFAGFEENIKGTIEMGKMADFAVFSQDIMTVPEDLLLETRVDYTIVNGTIVYKRK
jgi:hypothetical protein